MKNPNGWGSVHKLPGNRRNPWRVRITAGWTVGENGKAKQETKTLGYYPTQEEAMLALADYHRNPYSFDNKITFAELYDRWSKNKFPTISESNVKGYTASYNACTELYKMRFIDIRLAHLQSVIDSCGKNYPTLRKIRVLLSQLYTYAIQNDICDKDYSDFIDIIKHKDKKAPAKHKLFSQDELKIIWENAPRSDDIGIILMLIYSGVRISELLDLKKENVHFEERYFDVVESKTDAGIRKVPIAEKVAHIWKRWLNDNGEYVLHNSKGLQFEYTSYKRSHFEKPLEQIGLCKRYPHDTRHTCVSMLAAADVNKILIKRIVGHQGEDVTDNVYTHFEIQQLIDAINLI